MKIISKLTLMALPLLLTSCLALRPYLMVPAGYEEDKGCLYHYYGRDMPKCKDYKFLPVDGQEGEKKKPVSIKDYQQYQGTLIYDQ